MEICPQPLLERRLSMIFGLAEGITQKKESFIMGR